MPVIYWIELLPLLHCLSICGQVKEACGRFLIFMCLFKWTLVKDGKLVSADRWTQLMRLLNLELLKFLQRGNIEPFTYWKQSEVAQGRRIVQKHSVCSVNTSDLLHLDSCLCILYFQNKLLPFYLQLCWPGASSGEKQKCLILWIWRSRGNKWAPSPVP